MPLPAAGANIQRPPADFDELVEWLEGWSYRLVLLEEYPLADLQAAIAATGNAIRSHRTEIETRLSRIGPGGQGTAPLLQVVRSDHEWFEISVDQFGWFLRIVEGEDHGGHRQALGQFGRVLAEALRRHRRDEQRLLSATKEHGPRTTSKSRENTN